MMMMKTCGQPDAEGQDLCRFQPDHNGGHSWEAEELSSTAGPDIDEDMLDRVVALAWPGAAVQQLAAARRDARLVMRAVMLDAEHSGAAQEVAQSPSVERLAVGIDKFVQPGIRFTPTALAEHLFDQGYVRADDGAALEE